VPRPAAPQPEPGASQQPTTTDRPGSDQESAKQRTAGQGEYRDMLAGLIR
jgi:hypothetical protein